MQLYNSRRQLRTVSIIRVWNKFSSALLSIYIVPIPCDLVQSTSLSQNSVGRFSSLALRSGPFVISTASTSAWADSEVKSVIGETSICSREENSCWENSVTFCEPIRCLEAREFCFQIVLVGRLSMLVRSVYCEILQIEFWNWYFCLRMLSFVSTALGISAQNCLVWSLRYLLCPNSNIGYRFLCLEVEIHYGMSYIRSSFPKFRLSETCGRLLPR